ncbi:ER protein BIG1 [Drepanopeziza brunnea f. sp. 'multigermtubi' MB_m1]|uniref:Protein BIG1 n=1 Tax=Marssonina brunnea f. sp. multigermtubi (strain MB_m1) TaxID=1072389 RepID=K1WUJ7_MARBU|nr:ER protein BIG1 [Drepanopeziza brunnea f. sp. 'multigermtubi' MB_m1]EKD16107.1 ER protein BIG1 [Drepanopeziza brunnea f. sp. 'multigermtubi' MB_m1]
MRLSLAALAATAACANAFRDTSPFVMFSNAAVPSKPLIYAQLQSSHSVLETAKAVLGECQSDVYLVLAQPSILSSEVRENAPHLNHAVRSAGLEKSFSVSEVVGATVADGGEMVDLLVSRCGAERIPLGEWKGLEKGEGKKVVLNGVLPAIAGAERRRAVGDNGMSSPESATYMIQLVPQRLWLINLNDVDAKLFSLLRKLEGTQYTVIYHTTPADVVAEQGTEQIVYEASFEDVVHMDLKRDLSAREKNATVGDVRPLFEKYQFFSPGLFMGLLVSLLLLSILWVGISAISSLEVSYGAFDKEMGPAAQKKQQ